MIDNNWYIDLAIASDRDLAGYLQSRPHDEELGESLDLYEQKLRKEGKLTELEGVLLLRYLRVSYYSFP